MKIRKLVVALGIAAVVRAALRRHRALELRGRVVAITGGSRGLGLELARVFVARGARVALCARDGAELERARSELGAFTTVCDVTDRDDVIAWVAAVEDEVGPIDVLVNCAGTIQVGPLEALTVDDFDRALDVNLRGPLYATLAVLPHMRARRAGRIANIASVGGKLALPHMAPYSASKFGLVGLSEAMRAELVADGIYVTTVCPGLMRTGSAQFAWVKGQQRAEYAWFSLASRLPVVAMSAASAAEQIVRAIEGGEPEVVLSPQAKLASLVHGVAPGLVQEVLGLVARLLPRGGSREAKQGKDIAAQAAPRRAPGRPARHHN
jgi:NAD(P)-dependent dehydrogenase (short-subunit alcohol dehydrogenase family)